MGGAGVGGRSSRTKRGPQKGHDLKFATDIAVKRLPLGIEKEIPISRIETVLPVEARVQNPERLQALASIAMARGRFNISKAHHSDNL